MTTWEQLSIPNQNALAALVRIGGTNDPGIIAHDRTWEELNTLGLVHWYPVDSIVSPTDLGYKIVPKVATMPPANQRTAAQIAGELGEQEWTALERLAKNAWCMPKNKSEALAFKRFVELQLAHVDDFGHYRISVTVDEASALLEAARASAPVAGKPAEYSYPAALKAFFPNVDPADFKEKVQVTETTATAQAANETAEGDDGWQNSLSMYEVVSILVRDGKLIDAIKAIRTRYPNITIDSAREYCKAMQKGLLVAPKDEVASLQAELSALRDQNMQLRTELKAWQNLFYKSSNFIKRLFNADYREQDEYVKAVELDMWQERAEELIVEIENTEMPKPDDLRQAAGGEG